MHLMSYIVNNIKRELSNLEDPKERAELVEYITRSTEQYLNKLNSKSVQDVRIENFKNVCFANLHLTEDEHLNAVYDVTKDTVLNELFSLVDANSEEIAYIVESFGCTQDELKSRIGWIYSDWGNSSLRNGSTVGDLLEIQ